MVKYGARVWSSRSVNMGRPRRRPGTGDDNTQDLDRPQPRELGADDPARLPSQDRREQRDPGPQPQERVGSRAASWHHPSRHQVIHAYQHYPRHGQDSDGVQPGPPPLTLVPLGQAPHAHGRPALPPGTRPAPCPLLPHVQLISLFSGRRLVFESLRARRISQVVAGSVQQALLQDVHRPGDHEDSDD